MNYNINCKYSGILTDCDLGKFRGVCNGGLKKIDLRIAITEILFIMPIHDEPTEPDEPPQWYLDIEDKISEIEEMPGMELVADTLLAIFEIVANDKIEREYKDRDDALSEIHIDDFYIV